MLIDQSSSVTTEFETRIYCLQFKYADTYAIFNTTFVQNVVNTYNLIIKSD